MTRKTNITELAHRVLTKMKIAEDSIKLKNLKKLGESYNSLKGIIEEIKLSELFDEHINFESIEAYLLEELQIMCEEKIGKLEDFIEALEDDFSKEMKPDNVILK